jgi:hypothetical protein
VQETKTSDGFLGARITAFEYNGSIYADNALEDFIPEANTGLSDPNIFDKPTTPIVSLAPVANGAINYFTVSSNVPATGTTLYMDFNYGNSSNVATHKSYSTLQLGDGATYAANTTLTLNVADLNPATYYWSTSARNDLAGRQSNSSSAFVWAGPSVSTYSANTGNGGIGFDQISSSVEGVSRKIAGVNFSIPLSGTGNGVLAPVSVTANTTNVPVIIPEETVVATNYYPPFQNTSSTTSGTDGNNFYRANSTGTYGPKLSWTLDANPGDDGWWMILSAEWANNTFQDREAMKVAIGLTLVSTSNTGSTVQIVQSKGDDGTNVLISQLDDMGTYRLNPNEPQRIEMTTTFFNPISNNISNTIVTGTLIRNISGSNVIVVKGSMNVSATKWPF